MYEHIFVNASNLEDACRRSVDDLAEPWSERAELDFDGSRSTTIARIVEIPEPLFPNLRTRDDEKGRNLSEILYQSGLEALRVPSVLDESDELGFV
jgi:hypothetical protein